MKQHIEYNKETDEFLITITVPKTKRGKFTLDTMVGVNDGPEWEADAVCVWVNDRWGEYALYHTQYLDYKDSLQATAPIIHFETKEEALKFAEEHNLMVEYSRV